MKLRLNILLYYDISCISFYYPTNTQHIESEHIVTFYRTYSAQCQNSLQTSGDRLCAGHPTGYVLDRWNAHGPHIMSHRQLSDTSCYAWSTFRSKISMRCVLVG